MDYDEKAIEINDVNTLYIVQIVKTNYVLSAF